MNQVLTHSTDKPLNRNERLVAMRYIPKGARRVADKLSSAVAYVYETVGVPYAMGYAGNANKSSFNYRFKNEAQRSQHLQQFFEDQRRTEAYKATRAAERRARQAQPHKLKVGDVLVSSWGYDQTNIDFYQVTALIGSRMVEIREIGQEREATGWEQGTCVPKPGVFRQAEAMRKVVSDYDGASVRLNSFSSAYLWDGRPRNWTSYA